MPTQLFHHLDFNPNYDITQNGVEKLAPCKYKIAYASDASTDHLNLRLRMKEFRIWNKAMSIVDLQEYDRTTLPLRFPSLVVLIKMNNLDFNDEITGKSNFKSDFKDYKIKYDNQTRNNCPLGMRQMMGGSPSGVCEYMRGKTIVYEGSDKLTINFESTIEKLQQDQELDFTLIFMLNSYFTKDLTWLPEYKYIFDMVQIGDNIVFQTLDFYRFLIIYTSQLTGDTQTAEYFHGAGTINYVINFLLSQNQIHIFQEGASIMKIQIQSADEITAIKTISFGYYVSLQSEQRIQVSGVRVFYPTLNSSYSNYYEQSYQRFYMSQVYLFDYIKGQISLPSLSYSYLALWQSGCIGGMNMESSFMQGCLPKAELFLYNTRIQYSFANKINFKWQFSTGLWYKPIKLRQVDSSFYNYFYQLLGIIAFGPQYQIDKMKFCVLTIKGLQKSKVYTCFDRLIIQEGQWYGITAVKQNKGFWQIYNSNINIGQAEDSMESQSGLLSQIAMGDFQSAGITMKLKNVFGIAKELLDEDVGRTFYDSSLYGNTIDSRYIYQGSDGKIIWGQIQNQGYPSVIQGLVSFYVGSENAANTFTGYLRHIKVFKRFLSFGQSFQILHHKTGIINNMNYYNLAASYPFTEPIGNFIREQVSGEFKIIIDTQQHEYISYPSLPIMCDGDFQYSNRGYCQEQFQMQIQNRIYMDLDLARDSLLLQQSLNNAPFMKIAGGIGDKYLNNWMQFKYPNRIVQYQQAGKINFDERGKKNVIINTALDTSLINFAFKSSTGTVVPKNKDLSILIGYFKLDESAGTNLYNTATHVKSQRIIQLSDGIIKWIYETALSNQVQAFVPIKCNEHFSQQVDQHCESWNQCNTNCFNSQECKDQDYVNCMNKPSVLFQYSESDDYYLDCFQDCSQCNEPWVNNCNKCLDSNLYQNTCIFVCPKNTYVVYDADLDQNMCLPCNRPLCVCDEIDINACYRCIEDSNGLFIKSPIPDCILACGEGTYYDQIQQTCTPCSYQCSTCTGSTNGECQSCKEKFIYIDGKCFIPECPTNQYLNLTIMDCIDCDKSCESCTGPGPNQCVKCASEYDIYQTKCTNCDQIPGFKSPMIENQCSEICGDGKQKGQNECDDGNFQNGDGCDENCMIESGFSCENSICQQLEPPKLIIQSYTNELIIFTFNYQMTAELGPLTKNDIGLLIKLPDNTLKNITWTGNIDQESIRKNKYSLQIKIQYSLKGDEVLIIKLLSNKLRPQNQGVPIPIYQQATIKVQPYEYRNEERSALLMEMVAQAKTVLISALSSNMIAQILMQGTMGQMFEMINTLQILYYMPLIQVYYPQDLRDFLDFLSTSNFNIPVPGISDPESFINNLIDEKQYNEQAFNQAFYDFGIQGTVFVLQYKSKLVLWFIQSQIMIWFMLLTYIYRRNDMQLFRIIFSLVLSD
ncbi:UNKNOWN [Stylonychia lemnae]|uniref:Insulin-like growth factor binding protein, N-terminal n=1 Tax=Stylonychia lemnae TaxID=5949 RepID=A0A078B009_STYLE|nr:UNKNOWN [Stylonychia lemnae]|eukprot:CDW87671.1 UNKNOWN [Stylonychia lemnae]